MSDMSSLFRLGQIENEKKCWAHAPILNRLVKLPIVSNAGVTPTVSLPIFIFFHYVFHMFIFAQKVKTFNSSFHPSSLTRLLTYTHTLAFLSKLSFSQSILRSHTL